MSMRGLRECVHVSQKVTKEYSCAHQTWQAGNYEVGLWISKWVLNLSLSFTVMFQRPFTLTVQQSLLVTFFTFPLGCVHKTTRHRETSRDRMLQREIDKARHGLWRRCIFTVLLYFSLYCWAPCIAILYKRCYINEVWLIDWWKK